MQLIQSLKSGFLQLTQSLKVSFTQYQIPWQTYLLHLQLTQSLKVSFTRNEANLSFIILYVLQLTQPLKVGFAIVDEFTNLRGFLQLTQFSKVGLTNQAL